MTQATTDERDLSHWRTTKDVAEKHGVKVRDVQYYIKSGALQATKVGYLGYFYLIHEKDLPKVWPPGTIPPPNFK